jgi:hypothetical protein
MAALAAASVLGSAAGCGHRGRDPAGGPRRAPAGAIGDADPLGAARRLRSLQPDFWPDEDELVRANIGGVAMNFVWAAWQPARKAAPCDGAAGEVSAAGSAWRSTRIRPTCSRRGSARAICPA